MTESIPSCPTPLLVGARLNEQANRLVGPVLALQMQQAIGNRATRRWLQRAAVLPTVQRSPLSEQVDKLYAGKNKEAVFDLLRTNSPQASTDADLGKWLAANFAGNDLWLAQKIQQKGPEVLWDNADFEERFKRGDDKWAPGHGPAEGKIGKSGGLVGAQADIQAFYFAGETDQRALIIGGIHGSELSGIEVAIRLKNSLLERFNKQRKLPHFTTIIVPELFPETAALARSERARSKGASRTADSSTGREVDVPWTKPKDERERLWKAAHATDKMPAKKSLPPARQFPAEGKTVDDLINAGGPTEKSGARLKDDEGVDIPLMMATVALLKLIERFKPSRIASVHAHRFDDAKGATKGVDAPGVFVDPRGGFDKTIDPAFPKQVEKARAAAKKAKKVADVAQKKFDAAKKAQDAAQKVLDKATKVADAKSAQKKLDAATVKVQTAQNELDAAKKNVADHPLREAADVTALTPEGKKDDALALAIAKEVKKGSPGSVPGSHVDKSGPAVVHYAESAGHPKGRSLGDWGPEHGMTVITVEVRHQFEAGADKERAKELQAHSDALQKVFLETN